jgi:hypothetical protein
MGERTSCGRRCWNVKTGVNTRGEDPKYRRPSHDTKRIQAMARRDRLVTEVAADRLGVNTRTLKYYEQGMTSNGTVLEHVPISIGLAALALRFGRDVQNTAGGGNETD